MGETRRFRCANPLCRRRIFAERLPASIARRLGRRTERLDEIVRHLGLALGGRPGEAIARRLLLPVSKDTLLRTVRRRATAVASAPRVIGVDDWAWRKGRRYGTLICDLERREVMTCCPTASRRRSPPGSRRTRPSRSSRATAAAATARRLRRAGQRLFRWLTDGM